MDYANVIHGQTAKERFINNKLIHFFINNHQAQDLDEDNI
jgi:hypothetical protein